MPTYDYQCRACGHTIEVIHAMSADGPTTCEVCGGPLRRVLFPAGIIFKGSGFYKTDSRNSSSGSTHSRPAASASADATSEKSAVASDAPSASPSSDGAASTATKPSTSGAKAPPAE